MNNRYSFPDLFTKEVDFDNSTKVKVSNIVIPKIQRPYAQGRTDGVCTYIRNTFLDEIFKNLTAEQDEIFDLNFIYGIIKPNNDEYKLELLDGQQRLTTLFLLYWYIANAELEHDTEKDNNIRECLSKFIYETRSTSSVFCQELASYKTDLGNKTPKEVIRNAKWYFKSFDRDSTISAMLTMLNAIHERYINSRRNNLFDKLQHLQFYVKSLGRFNLSEELYIKMNARGLQLTSFENFKADLSNYVSNSSFEPFKKLVPLYKKDSTDQVPFHFNFSVKLDAKWVDIFWKNGADDFDDAYMSFFSRFFACKYIVASKEEVSDREMRTNKDIKFFYTNAEERIGSNEYFGFESFVNLLDKHPEYIFTLDKVLDVIYQYDTNSKEKYIFESLCPTWDKNNETIGDDFYCNSLTKMSHVKLIALGAIIEFIEAMPTFNIQTYNQWMRSVWNIIENTNIDSLTPVSSLIRKFSAIIHFIALQMNHGISFYEALSMWQTDKTTENRAVIEEVEKARRIAEDDAWENIWKDVESHPYFRGMATFFYKPDMTIEEYAACANQAKSMFDVNGISNTYKKQHILIRAIVSQFNTWNEIDQLYITENAEKNKFLKNILASNEKVRNMLADVLHYKTSEKINAALQEYINNAEKPQAWQGATEEAQNAINMAISRLREDVLMYDWISSEAERLKSCFRIYWYEGHIMFAIPRRVYAKIALDTERGKMAASLCQDYGFIFEDENQKGMYKLYKDCFGNEIWLSQERRSCTVWIGFLQHHELVVRVKCKTQKYAKELLTMFEGSLYVKKEDETLIQIASLKHSTKSQSYPKLCKCIDAVFKGIPEKEESI